MILKKRWASLSWLSTRPRLKQRQDAAIEGWANMSSGDRAAIIEEVQTVTNELRDETSQKLYGKNYSELSSVENLSRNFRAGFAQEVAAHLHYALNHNPLAGAAEAMAPAVGAKAVLTLIEGAGSAEAAGGALANLFILREYWLTPMLRED